MDRILSLTAGVLLAAAPLLAQQPATPAPAAKKPMMAAPKTGMTDAQKIAGAERAAPRSISAHATIVEMGATMDAPMKELRKGTNDWVCITSMTNAANGKSDPMCMDKSWQDWAQAYMAHRPPNVSGSGVAYMLMGDLGASNTDPYAEKETADNHWVVSPAHIMMLYADPKALDGYTDDPHSGGPWVMWKGTPYAHLMVPVAAPVAHTMKASAK